MKNEDTRLTNELNPDDFSDCCGVWIGSDNRCTGCKEGAR